MRKKRHLEIKIKERAFQRWYWKLELKKTLFVFDYFCVPFSDIEVDIDIFLMNINKLIYFNMSTMKFL